LHRASVQRDAGAVGGARGTPAAPRARRARVLAPGRDRPPPLPVRPAARYQRDWRSAIPVRRIADLQHERRRLFPHQLRDRSRGGLRVGFRSLRRLRGPRPAGLCHVPDRLGGSALRTRGRVRVRLAHAHGDGNRNRGGRRGDAARMAADPGRCPFRALLRGRRAHSRGHADAVVPTPGDPAHPRGAALHRGGAAGAHSPAGEPPAGRRRGRTGRERLPDHVRDRAVRCLRRLLHRGDLRFQS
jgi:hypothetical protein